MRRESIPLMFEKRVFDENSLYREIRRQGPHHWAGDVLVVRKSSGPLQGWTTSSTQRTRFGHLGWNGGQEELYLLPKTCCPAIASERTSRNWQDARFYDSFDNGRKWADIYDFCGKTSASLILFLPLAHGIENAKASGLSKRWLISQGVDADSLKQELLSPGGMNRYDHMHGLGRGILPALELIPKQLKGHKATDYCSIHPD